MEQHPEHIIRYVLIGLGVKAAEAERIADMPLAIPKAVDGPIFSRLEIRQAKKKSSK
jgi:hypothetical protein